MENKWMSVRDRRSAFRAVRFSRFDNHEIQQVKALCVITPAAIGPQYFRESAEVINTAAGGPPDRAKMSEIMRRHGLTPAAASVSPVAGDNLRTGVYDVS